MNYNAENSAMIEMARREDVSCPQSIGAPPSSTSGLSLSKEGEIMPTYQLLRDAIQITPTADDVWQDATTSTGEVRNGLLVCGNVRLRDNGQTVRLQLKLTGKPELERMLAELDANRATRRARIDAIPGLMECRAAADRLGNAQAAYERASERGYPPREAKAVDEADHAYTAARQQYPLAAAYLRAESYRLAANYRKVAAGQRAIERIEDGEDILIVIAEMEWEWAEAAREGVENS